MTDDLSPLWLAINRPTDTPTLMFCSVDTAIAMSPNHPDIPLWLEGKAKGCALQFTQAGWSFVDGDSVLTLDQMRELYPD